MMKDTKIITYLKELKNKTYEEIVISVFLALGINFLVLGISNEINIKNTFFTICLVTTLLAFIILINALKMEVSKCLFSVFFIINIHSHNKLQRRKIYAY